MEFVDEWLNQTFFGGKCTFGDDRSLTNFTIRKYEAVYSPKAIAHTVVPDTWPKYIKQQQRWKKSWIRETFIAATFMWKKNPLAALFFYLYLVLAFLSPVVFVRAIIWYPISTHLFPYIYMIGLLLMLCLQGIYYRIETGNRRWVLAILGAWWASVILIWQGGGPSHMDLWDLKPGSQNGGEFKEIETKAKGVRISEVLPTVAEQLASAGISPSALTGIVLTHAHWDHVSGLEDLPGVPVFDQSRANARNFIGANRGANATAAAKP
jgi:hypothetical protein